MVPRAGAPPRSIGTAALPLGSVYAYWLPDGSRVSLHEEGSRRVLIVDLTTEDTVAVPVGGRYDMLLAGSWSPDGRLFAVASLTGDPLRYAIRTVGPDGRTEVVAEDSIPLGSPRWSPGGDAVYYLRGGGHHTTIQRLPLSARTARPRGPPGELYSELEALSPFRGSNGAFSLTRDGRRMVYPRGKRFANLTMTMADGAWMDLTSGTALRWSPTVSPDGRWIGFAQETRDGAELFSMPVSRESAPLRPDDRASQMSLAGGNVRQITAGARVWPQLPVAWAPDGGDWQMAFASVHTGDPWVWVAGVADGRLQSFAGSRIAPFGGLTWASGARIAYRSADGRNITLLDPRTGTERPLLPKSARGRAFNPQYSPDGNRLALAWYPEGGIDPGIWVFDFRDSSFSNVDPGPKSVFKIDTYGPWGWSADGRYIYAGQHTRYGIDTRQRGVSLYVVQGQKAESDCTPAGPRRLGAFICAEPNVASEAWMIENFDARAP